MWHFLNKTNIIYVINDNYIIFSGVIIKIVPRYVYIFCIIMLHNIKYNGLYQINHLISPKQNKWGNTYVVFLGLISLVSIPGVLNSSFSPFRNEKLPLSAWTSLQFDGLPPSPPIEKWSFCARTSDLQFNSHLHKMKRCHFRFLEETCTCITLPLIRNVNVFHFNLYDCMSRLFIQTMWSFVIIFYQSWIFFCFFADSWRWT